jgi:hypothetical protein
LVQQGDGVIKIAESGIKNRFGLSCPEERESRTLAGCISSGAKDDSWEAGWGLCGENPAQKFVGGGGNRGEPSVCQGGSKAYSFEPKNSLQRARV